MKGRIVLIFWLVALLAVVTTMASYAWLAMNSSARMRGFEVLLESDSLYLEISDDAEKDYRKTVDFSGALVYSANEIAHEISLVSYGVVRPEGAIVLYPTLLDASKASAYGDENGNYNGGDKRFYLRSESVIGKGDENFIDVTTTLRKGQSLVGYYVIQEGVVTHPTSLSNDCFYYVKTARGDGNYDYSCIGTFEVGETIAGRRYWGFSTSNSVNSSEPKNIMNVVSLDTPPEKYSLKRTVYMRGAVGTGDLVNLKISSVEVDGMRNYLTDSIRILFVATSDRGISNSTIYSHRNPELFDRNLLDGILGNAQEIVTVDMYVYFDGKDEAAYATLGLLTSQSISVRFVVEDHSYN